MEEINSEARALINRNLEVTLQKLVECRSDLTKTIYELRSDPNSKSVSQNNPEDCEEQLRNIQVVIKLFEYKLRGLGET